MVRSGELPISSAKLFSADTVLAPVRSMALIALGLVAGAVPLPPVLPATVLPLKVPTGCAGWVTV